MQNSVRRFRWGRLLLGFLGVEAGMIGASIAWVAIYSHMLHPGQPMEAYHQHAELSAPWASFVAGPPAFYLLCRWASAGGRDVWRSPALGIYALYFLLDVTFFLLAYPRHLPGWFAPVTFAMKGAAAYLGARAAVLRARAGA